jgi:adenylate kinase
MLSLANFGALFMATTASDKAAWLQGPGADCTFNTEPPQRAYRLILLGAPGVGKGTQAEFLCKVLGTCHLSTGDVFRAAKGSTAEPSPAMKVALDAMQRGELVTDETVLNMVAERAGCMHCPFGFLLDGFPRTLNQARALDVMLGNLHQSLDGVLSFDVPEEEIVRRLSGRRTCRGCNATFHVESKPSKKEGVCDLCGGELYQRGDDNAESIRTRLQAYQEQTKPLADYYAAQGLLIPVSASGSPEEVHKAAMCALQEKIARKKCC